MTYLLIGLIIGVILGVILGDYIIAKFDVVNSEYSIEKLKAKKGAKIDVMQLNDLESKPKIKRKLFNFKNRRK
mgnify:CR=1 FL=1